MQLIHVGLWVLTIMVLAVNAWVLANISRSLWNISDKYLSKRDGRERKNKTNVLLEDMETLRNFAEAGATIKNTSATK